MSKNNNLEYYSEEKILNPPLHVRDEIDIIFRYLTKDKKKRIVDFGSGGGRLTIPLLQSEYKITAIDIDKKSQEQLLKTATKIGKNKNLQISKTFQKNGKYDYILGTDILHHLDIGNYFRLFNSHLKKGGKIIFSEPNSWHLFWWVFIFLFLDFKKEKGLVQCSYFSLERRLKKSGFSNIKISGFNLFPPYFISKIKLLRELNYYLSNLVFLKLFAFHLFIEAEK